MDRTRGGTESVFLGVFFSFLSFISSRYLFASFLFSFEIAMKIQYRKIRLSKRTGNKNILIMPYKIDLEMEKITGWKTKEEWAAYEKGRSDEERVYTQFIRDWDGSTNSTAGQILFDKFKELRKLNTHEHRKGTTQRTWLHK